MPTDRPVTLAAIAGAHGVTGEVRLKLFAESVASIKRHERFNGGALTLVTIRANKAEAIARFAEVPDRNAAEALRGTLLTVPRSALPPLAEGEYYHSDIIGLAAVSTDGTPLGEVVAIQNYGAGDLVEIAPNDGPRLLVPMTADAVPEWDDTRLLVAAEWAV